MTLTRGTRMMVDLLVVLLVLALLLKGRFRR